MKAQRVHSYEVTKAAQDALAERGVTIDDIAAIVYDWNPITAQ